MNPVVGIVFSGDPKLDDPLAHVGEKRPTYERLLELCAREGWRTFVFTRRNYLGEGVFAGGWEFQKRKLVWVEEEITADLVYDRTGGVRFPLEGDSLRVVNVREFKILCWDKWAAYQILAEDMPRTFWVGSLTNLNRVVRRIRTDWVVIKPYNGLQGRGIYIGPKDQYSGFEFNPKYKKYIAQEFVDTTAGVPGVVTGMHDIRVAVVNGKAVWSHVRVPPKGGFKANAAAGGVLTEINYGSLPSSIKEIVGKVAKKFCEQYDNPIFSLDFGVGKDDRPSIFEINDQIGFPRWEMQNRDNFLTELVKNFAGKLTTA